MRCAKKLPTQGVVERKGVFVEEEEEKKEDDAVEKLLAGDVPLLAGGDTDGESHHKDGSADECCAGEDAEDEGEAEDSFEEWNRVAEGVCEAVRQWGFCKVCGGRHRERADSVVDADEAMTGKVDTEGNAEERIGEGIVIDLHSCLRRAAGEPSYILAMELKRSGLYFEPCIDQTSSVLAGVALPRCSFC